MNKPTGRHNSIDLSKDAQYYYDKMIEFINVFSFTDRHCEETIECLDNLIDELLKTNKGGEK